MAAGYELKNETTKEVKEIENYFTNLWKDQKPIAKLFRTNASGYLYDTGTNKIIKCANTVFDLIEKFLSMNSDKAIEEFIAANGKESFLETAAAVKKSIEQEQVLITKKASNFGFHDPQKYEEMIEHALQILILETTENCNLRCDYCVYNPGFKSKRNHGQKNMTLHIAHKAIDYLKKHSSKSKEVAVTFYGGEPLLTFPFIKSCVEYTKSNLKKRKTSFSITTNGTLLTREMAHFFKENNFSVIVSIDGPQEIHDEYRKNMAGEGSFKQSIQGLKNLIDVFGKSIDKIQLSMVYTPPFSSNKIDRVASLWQEIPWLPHNIGIAITYPSPGSILQERTTRYNPSAEDKDLLEWSFEQFFNNYTGEKESHPLTKNILEKELAKLMTRPISDNPVDRYNLQGCCIPGVRRLFVSTDGTFRICERISTDAPPIGNIETGVDVDLINSVYIEGYKRVTNPLCSECWATRLCSACYTDIFKDGNLDRDSRESECVYYKKTQERILKYYCTLLETKPKGLDYLYKYKII